MCSRRCSQLKDSDRERHRTDPPTCICVDATTSRRGSARTRRAEPESAGFFDAIARYGVTKMTTNIHAGDMRKRISRTFMVILVVLALVYLRVFVLQTVRAETTAS